MSSKSGIFPTNNEQLSTAFMRRSLTTLALLLLTIPTGLALRYAPLHLPWFLYKYLGSTL